MPELALLQPHVHKHNTSIMKRFYLVLTSSTELHTCLMIWKFVVVAITASPVELFAGLVLLVKIPPST